MSTFKKPSRPPLTAAPLSVAGAGVPAAPRLADDFDSLVRIQTSQFTVDDPSMNVFVQPMNHVQKMLRDSPPGICISGTTSAYRKAKAGLSAEDWEKWDAWTANAFQALSQEGAERLKALVFAQIPIPKDNLRPCAKLSALEVLRIEDCVGIDCDSLAPFEECTALKLASFKGCAGLRDGAVRWLVAARGLQVLNLDHTNCSDISLLQATSHTNLRRVSAAGNPRITDAGVGILLGGDPTLKLTHLCLANCKGLTSDVLSCLSNCSTLQHLDLTGTLDPSSVETWATNEKWKLPSRSFVVSQNHLLYDGPRIEPMPVHEPSAHRRIAVPLPAPLGRARAPIPGDPRAMRT